MPGVLDLVGAHDEKAAHLSHHLCGVLEKRLERRRKAQVPANAPERDGPNCRPIG
jgi:hypothetical protein